LPAETLPLKRGLNRLGRSSQNDFQIHHDTISRFHCEVEVNEEAMLVRDLDSSNGTFVDDEAVSKATLLTGQCLRLGDVSLEVVDAPAPPDPDAIPMCVNHPNYPASMRCTQCGRLLCGPCLHILKLAGGKAHKLCPACSGHCESLQGMNRDRRNLFSHLVQKLFRR
jgi:hypothetical protein